MSIIGTVPSSCSRCCQFKKESGSGFILRKQTRAGVGHEKYAVRRYAANI